MGPVLDCFWGLWQPPSWFTWREAHAPVLSSASGTATASHLVLSTMTPVPRLWCGVMRHAFLSAPLFSFYSSPLVSLVPPPSSLFFLFSLLDRPLEQGVSRHGHAPTFWEDKYSV